MDENEFKPTARDGSVSLSPLPAITQKIEQAGKAITRIDVVLDDIKREVIEPTKTPNGDAQQGGVAPRWHVEQQKDRGQDSSHEKERAL